MRSLRGGSAFNAASWGLRKGLMVWLVGHETWTKWWPTESQLEMPGIPWFNVEEGIYRQGQLEC